MVRCGSVRWFYYLNCLSQDFQVYVNQLCWMYSHRPWKLKDRDIVIF